MISKAELREYAKNIRKNLPLGVISQKAIEQIRQCDLYIESKNVMIYYPTRYEINLLELLKDDRNFYLPRVKGKDLEACPYKMGDKMIKSDFGIMEPVCESVSKSILDLVIAPALMADSKNYRLGYGGGYYDRFICADFKTITVIPQKLYIDYLPIEEIDKKIDKIIFV